MTLLHRAASASGPKERSSSRRGPATGLAHASATSKPISPLHDECGYGSDGSARRSAVLRRASRSCTAIGSAILSPANLARSTPNLFPAFIENRDR